MIHFYYSFYDAQQRSEAADRLSSSRTTRMKEAIRGNRIKSRLSKFPQFACRHNNEKLANDVIQPLNFPPILISLLETFPKF